MKSSQVLSQATVTQNGPLRILPDGSATDAPALFVGAEPAVSDRVFYLYASGNQLVVLGSIGVVRSANPGTAVGTDAAVINAIISILVAHGLSAP